MGCLKSFDRIALILIEVVQVVSVLCDVLLRFFVCSVLFWFVGSRSSLF